MKSAQFPLAPLFVPAHVEKLTNKALAMTGQALILDLEDAVPAEQKGLARVRAAEFMGQRPNSAYVRINTVRANDLAYIVPCGEEDLATVVVKGLLGVVLPKVESAQDVIFVDAHLRALERVRGIEPGQIKLLALIESAKGVAQLSDIVQPRLSRPWCLCFGAGDYTTDLGVGWTEQETESQSARSLVVLYSAAAGLPPPIDSAYPDIANETAFRASATNALTLGFQGKFAIHPSQVRIVEEVFRPAAKQIEWARRVLTSLAAAEAEGRGAFSVDGRMVDYPIVERARRILQAA